MWRSLKNWRENLVSLAGLSIGMMIAILSVSYIVFESSYDTFHPASNRIFTVYTRYVLQGSSPVSFAVESGMKSYAVDNVPAVETACIVRKTTTDLTLENTVFKGIDGYFTEPEFFSLFDFRLLSGDPGLLAEPGTIFLTVRLAEKLFGGIDCSGKVIMIADKPYTVSGIVKDPPVNSNLDFDFLLPELKAEAAARSQQDAEKVNLYILTKTANAETASLQDNLDEYFISAGREKERTEVIALRDLHQYSSRTEKTFLIFISISLLVLFTSMVNFLNTHFARIRIRTREIGMRKVNGASVGTIIRMIIAETVVMTLIAAIAGLILSGLSLGYFQKLTSVTVQMFGPGLWKIQTIVFVLTLLLGVTAGFIISVRYSGYNTIDLIRGLFRTERSYMRKVLIGLQFAISGGLIILMIILYQQLDFLKRTDMGFDPQNRLLIELSPVHANKYEMIRTELLNLSGIEMVTGRGSTFGNVDMAMSLLKGENKPENRFFTFGYNVEDGFFGTYGIKLIEGKTFSDISGRDSSLIIMDRFTAGTLGLEHPVGEKLRGLGMTLEVIGLVEDADFISLSSKRMPRIYLQASEQCGEVTVKYHGDTKLILAEIGELLTQLDPDYSLEYQRLDDAVMGLYKKEINLFNIIAICGIIAIVLSLTGAYAMAVYLAGRKLRPNSIRRVFGASEREITIRSILEIGLPVLLGNLAVWPVAYLVGEKWLSQFSEKITIGAFPFIVSLLLISLLVAGTVYIISRRSVYRNPAEILRQE
jgi:ABC-type antimicrobial peptide transport system permease subunit